MFFRQQEVQYQSKLDWMRQPAAAAATTSIGDIHHWSINLSPQLAQADKSKKEKEKIPKDNIYGLSWGQCRLQK